MGQDYLEEFKTKIREQLQKEAEQEVREEVAKIYLETTNYNDETIAEKVKLDTQQVRQFRMNYEKWLCAKNLKITTEPQCIMSGLPSQCLPSDMYVKGGNLDGAENMLLLGLHATGLRRFLEIISNDTKQNLRKMLEQQDLD